MRILLVEDDELFRLGLQVRLQQEPEFEIVAEAEDGETAIEVARSQPLDVVLLDVGLPGIGGVEACRQLKMLQPSLPILVLTSRQDAVLFSRLIEAGAQGYCLKGVAAETLILAIRSVAKGASWWDSTATQMLRQTVIHTPLNTATESLATGSIEPHRQSTIENPLTQREQEILAFIAQGYSNQDIAQTLYISAGTVRVHVHSILHKLGVSDRLQAVQAAKSNAWLSDLSVIEGSVGKGD
ncbi:MAG: DNA-binding response regulator [Alkalinema sp. CACIAM 70d]|nr:MAG: DNA-binding response regulator [Alkalinema sp. CACIAM 70d]